jgi:hypothetical protein
MLKALHLLMVKHDQKTKLTSLEQSGVLKQI